MELKYQFNKVSMQALQKQLNVRLAALPDQMCQGCRAEVQ